MAGRLSARGVFVAAALQLLGALGCTPTTDLSEERFGGRGRVRTTQGSAVAVTFDQRVAVVTNRTDGIVTIVRLDPSRPLGDLVVEGQQTELPFAPLNESMPWAAVIGADDDTAYVLLRGKREVVEIAGLHSGNPRLGLSAPVGAEPTSIVISPNGRRLWVANSNEGTLTLVVTKTMRPETWYLNHRLAEAGFLGESVRERPGLAHPRALAMTDNGDTDELDELLYATEFFSQPIAGATGEDPDRERQGIVYPFDIGGNPPLNEAGEEVPLISLSPVETGFNDALGATACFPNQLYSAAAQGNRLFVTSVCASPAGPVEPGPAGSPENFKTLLHSAVFAIDTTRQREVPDEGILLTRYLEDSYPLDAADRRMPLIPSEIVMEGEPAGSGRQAYVSSFGSGAVFPLRYDDAGVGAVGAENARYINLEASTLPTGMALLSGKRALVLDDYGRLGLADLEQGRVIKWIYTVSKDWAKDPDVTAAELPDPDVRKGRNLFVTGLRAWSLQGQGWSSCESCHPEGLSDGVVWRVARGPRRTISLAGTYYRDEDQRRLLLWTANLDEVHDFEAVARNLSGGVGGVVWNAYRLKDPHKNCRLIYDGGAPAKDEAETDCGEQRATEYRMNGLNGSLAAATAASVEDRCQPGVVEPCNKNASNDWDLIDAYVRSIRAPHAPINLTPSRVDAGRDQFVKRGCPTCHSGAGWTLSKVFYTPSTRVNGETPSVPPLAPADMPPVAPDPIMSSWLGELRLGRYTMPGSAPEWFRASNPPAESGSATFRVAPKELTARVVHDHVFAKPALPDYINCALRAVGTFGAPAEPDFSGVFPPGAPKVEEVSHVLDQVSQLYVKKVAGGASGFNIPSLVGLSGGAPYFHAGNARTLEELFHPVFGGHYIASIASAPTAEELADLVTYLLSIDESESSELLETPTDAFDPDLCAQFVPTGVQ